MNRCLLIILFLLLTNTVFAQKGKDSAVYKMPVVKGRLIYEDSINVRAIAKLY
jgi:hypothetical protein